MILYSVDLGLPQDIFASITLVVVSVHVKEVDLSEPEPDLRIQPEGVLEEVAAALASADEQGGGDAPEIMCAVYRSALREV